MRPADLVSMAITALIANPVRTGLTMLGIIFGVACVICMAGIGAGAELRVVEQIRAFGANVILIKPMETKREAAHGAGAKRPLTTRDAQAIADLPHVSGVAPSVFGSVQVVRGNRHWTTVLNGTVADHFAIREWKIQSGRTFSTRDDAEAGKVVIIGALVAEKLFEDEDPIGQTIRILDAPFTIIGVLAKKGAEAGNQSQDDVVFAPISTATIRIIGSANLRDRNAVAYILASASSEATVAPAVDAITALLRQRHGAAPDEAEDFTVTSAESALSAQRESARTMSLLLASIAFISLVVGGIGIMNVMLVCVTERTAEIGLKLAIGAQPRDIGLQFLLEAVVICVTGGVFGVLIGIAVAWSTAGWLSWPVIIPPAAPAVAIGVAALVGVFFGYYPARRASMLDPVVALRSV